MTREMAEPLDCGPRVDRKSSDVTFGSEGGYCIVRELFVATCK